MAGLDVMDVRKKRLHEVIYALVVFRFHWPVIGHQDGSHFDGLDWSIVRNQFRIIVRSYRC